MLALVLALVGTATALPGRNTVNSGDIKNGTVKRPDLNPKVRKQLVPAVLKRGLTKAYALVNANGTVVASHSFRINSSHVTTPETGEYCFNVPFAVRHVQATAESSGNDGVLGNNSRDLIITARARPDRSVSAGIASRDANCPGAEDASVEIADPVSQDGAGGTDDASYSREPVNSAFYVEFK